MSFTQFPVSGVLKVPSSSALPALADQGDVAIAQDTGVTYAFKNGSWLVLATAGASGANTALSNLSSVAINASLTPASANAIDLGSAAKVIANVYTRILKVLGATSGTITIAAPATVTDHSLTLPGAQGAASTVLTNNGSGVLSWAAGGSGANVTLSNLTSPTAVNQALIPSTTLTLGTAANFWDTAYITFMSDTDDTFTIEVNNRILTDNGPGPSINWNSRILYDVSTVISLAYNDRVMKDSGGSNAIDWQARHLVQSNTAILDWSNSAQLSVGTPMILFTKTDPDPTGVEGMVYYNLTSHTIRWYNGTTWASLT